MTLRACLAVCLATVALLLPTRLAAHPHEFVTMHVRADFNDDGKLNGLTYHWSFDEFFSAYAVEGQDQNKNGKAEPEELQALLEEILGNIKQINYFTVFDEQATTPEFTTPKTIGAELLDRKLNLAFQLPFAEPVDLTKNKLRFAIYDDEFYIAMNFEPKGIAKTMPKELKDCSASLEAASPDDEVVAFASSLGKSESSGGGLGASFAEWMTLSCK